MGNVWADTAVVCVFFLSGGVFAAAEMALVSLRESQVKALSHQGKRGRTVAKLLSNPNRFLSAVQVGVTLSGFLSASFGGATLAHAVLTPVLTGWGLSARVGGVVALVVVTAIISFCSIVISELTAKRLAMQRPEGIALMLAPLINGLAAAFRPLIWALGVCTNGLVRLLGGDPKAGRETVSTEELRSMVTNAAALGAEERRIVDEVFNAGEHTLREVMVPRTEVDFLSADTAVGKALHAVRGAPHSRYPVIEGSPDRVIGFLHVRDLMDLGSDVREAPLRRLVRPVLFLPETLNVLPALTRMRRNLAHLAIVQDEYEGTAGIITLEDLVEELIGDITDEYDQVVDADLHARRSEFNGLLTVEEFAEQTGYDLPEGPYDTLAGFVMAQLGRVPALGDEIGVGLTPSLGGGLPERGDGSGVRPGPDGDAAGGGPCRWRMSVTEMDGRRIAWLRAEPEKVSTW